MVARRTTGQGQARLKANPIEYDSPSLDYAVHLIHQVCCLAGSFNLIEEFRDQDLCRAIDRHDTSFQGISDEIAANYMHKHGRATYRSVRKNLAKRPSCPKLKTNWHFYDCRYEKTSRPGFRSARLIS
jgi:hypothetical protein